VPKAHPGATGLSDPVKHIGQVLSIQSKQ